MENLNQNLEKFDEALVRFASRVAAPFARFSIFFVYFYFGAIKVFAEHGAANPMVSALLDKVMPGITPDMFIIVFGVFEMLIGLLFIFPYVERLGLFLLAIHFVAIIMPLFLLPDMTWQSFMVPTLEGQYIIKNILILAVVIGLFSRCSTLKEDRPHV